MRDWLLLGNEFDVQQLKERLRCEKYPNFVLLLLSRKELLFMVYTWAFLAGWYFCAQVINISEACAKFTLGCVTVRRRLGSDQDAGL